MEYVVLMIFLKETYYVFNQEESELNSSKKLYKI